MGTQRLQRSLDTTARQQSLPASIGVTQIPDYTYTQPPIAPTALTATIHQLTSSSPLTRQREVAPALYRDAVCDLTEKTVSLALTVPLAALQAKTRMTQDVALARQIAMYLCHTTFSLPLTEVGLHFKRDRTTVSHACALIEDKRDQMSFDVLLCQLEALLCDARDAAAHMSQSQNVTHDIHGGGN